MCPLSADKPKIILSSNEIKDGETVKVTCTLPIDYTGGDCRLFRENSPTPFRLKTATAYLCVFHLSSQELLGKHPVGSRVYLKCDYHIQQYTSVSSDIKGVTVWGERTSLSCSLSPESDVSEVGLFPPASSLYAKLG